MCVGGHETRVLGQHAPWWGAQVGWCPLSAWRKPGLGRSGPAAEPCGPASCGPRDSSVHLVNLAVPHSGLLAWEQDQCLPVTYRRDFPSPPFVLLCAREGVSSRWVPAWGSCSGRGVSGVQEPPLHTGPASPSGELPQVGVASFPVVVFSCSWWVTAPSPQSLLGRQSPLLGWSRGAVEPRSRLLPSPPTPAERPPPPLDSPRKFQGGRTQT